MLLARDKVNYSPGGLPADTWGYSRAETTTGDTYLIALDRINRIKREEMKDSGATLRYRYDHGYDSAGNRTSLDVSGNLQATRNFTYTFNAMGHQTQVAENVNLNNYIAAVTSDNNGSITQVVETWNGQYALTSTFEYDYENRLTEHNAASVAVTIEHKYDGLGRLVRTDRTVTGPTTTVFEHVRNGSCSRGCQPRISQAGQPAVHFGNIDATNTNTAPTWTNHPRARRPVESQQIQTSSATQFINVSDEIDPARRTYNPSTSAAGGRG